MSTHACQSLAATLTHLLQPERGLSTRIGCARRKLVEHVTTARGSAEQIDQRRSENPDFASKPPWRIHHDDAACTQSDDRLRWRHSKFNPKALFDAGAP